MDYSLGIDINIALIVILIRPYRASASVSCKGLYGAIQIILHYICIIVVHVSVGQCLHVTYMYPSGQPHNSSVKICVVALNVPASTIYDIIVITRLDLSYLLNSTELHLIDRIAHTFIFISSFYVFYRALFSCHVTIAVCLLILNVSNSIQWRHINVFVFITAYSENCFAHHPYPISEIINNTSAFHLWKLVSILVD